MKPMPQRNPMGSRSLMPIASGRRNGVSRVEIREVLLHVAIYGGVPCAVDSFRVAREALMEYEQTTGSRP